MISPRVTALYNRLSLCLLCALLRDTQYILYIYVYSILLYTENLQQYCVCIIFSAECTLFIAPYERVAVIYFRKTNYSRFKILEENAGTTESKNNNKVIQRMLI